MSFLVRENWSPYGCVYLYAHEYTCVAAVINENHRLNAVQHLQKYRGKKLNLIPLGAYTQLSGYLGTWLNPVEIAFLFSILFRELCPVPGVYAWGSSLCSSTDTIVLGSLYPFYVLSTTLHLFMLMSPLLNILCAYYCHVRRHRALFY